MLSLTRASSVDYVPHILLSTSDTWAPESSIISLSFQNVPQYSTLPMTSSSGVRCRNKSRRSRPQLEVSQSIPVVQVDQTTQSKQAMEDTNLEIYLLGLHRTTIVQRRKSWLDQDVAAQAEWVNLTPKLRELMEKVSECASVRKLDPSIPLCAEQCRRFAESWEIATCPLPSAAQTNCGTVK